MVILQALLFYGVIFGLIIWSNIRNDREWNEGLFQDHREDDVVPHDRAAAAQQDDVIDVRIQDRQLIFTGPVVIDVPLVRGMDPRTVLQGERPGKEEQGVKELPARVPPLLLPFDDQGRIGKRQ